jgi:SAM-dependent methyltransferase
VSTRTLKPKSPDAAVRPAEGIRVYEDRWGATRRVVQMRPHLWRDLSGHLDGKPVLEIGPGLRPTAPVRGSFFVETSTSAVGTLSRAGGRSVQVGAGFLPFRDRCFEAVLALEVLEHVEDDRRLIAEMARVLRPGGLAVVSVPLRMALWSATDESCAHVRRYEPDELMTKLRDGGLVAERFEARPSRSHPVMARVGSGVLRAIPRLSNWWLQNVVFAVHSGWHRRFGKLRWADAAERIPPEAGGITVVARHLPRA